MTICISVSLNTAILHANNNTEKKQKIITQEQAAILASKIANEKFQKTYGISPFTPESYTAELVDNKWRWGKISPAGINGCSAKVIFNKDGSNANVKVAFHTDELKFDIKQQPIVIDEVIPNIDIDDRKEK
jgi:hypothetical protein